MSDPNNPNPSSLGTSGSDANTIVEAFNALRAQIDDLKASGVSKEEATETVANRVGWNPGDLAKQIDEAEQAGLSRGEATMRAMTTVASTMAASTLDRDGRREVSNLAHSRARIPGTKVTIADAFVEHGTKFRSWLAANGYGYAQLADPERAEHVFRYYIGNATDFVDVQREKDLEAARAETRTKTQEEIAARTPKPVAPALPSGGRAEGGVLKRLTTQALNEAAEPSEGQAEIMAHLGLSEEAQKRAMDNHRKKTALGTPLDFVPVRNAAGIE